MKRQTISLGALALAGALLGSAPALARDGGPGHGDPELAQARRELMAATIVAKLQLTKEQKAALKKILLEARRVRDEARESPEARARRAKAKKLLRRATAEVRARGEMRPETREALDALRAEGKAERKERRETMRELMKSARDVLTPEQMRRLHELRPPLPPGEHGGPTMAGPGMGPPPAGGPRGPGMGPPPAAGRHGPGMRGPGHRKKRMLMRLLLSDAFIAELDR